MDHAASRSRATPPLATEIVAGITTFFTMAYILVVNPAILSDHTGMAFAGVMSATVILAFSMTLLMGLYARLPFAVAPGMGINAFFAYSLILGQKVPWPTALGAIFWAGVFFLIASVTPLRVQIARAVPRNLRVAAAAGIGLFLTLIGLKNLGLVVASPATLVQLGPIDAKVLVGLAGMILAAWLMRRRSPFAFLACIGGVTAIAVVCGWVHAPEHLVAAPDFHSVLFKLDPMAALVPALAPAIVSILLTDLFDSLSTFMGVAVASGLVDEQGEPLRLKQALTVDALATLFAGLLGTSSGTAFIESAAGIEAGGRTGRTAVVTALCFLPCLFLAPLAAAVPIYATAPVLVLVGALMFRAVRELSLTAIEDAVPAFLTIALIPLTFSITQGILWGFLAHVVLYVLCGRRKDVAPMMYAIAATAVALLWMQR